ncbi:hypothetical protein A9K55_007787 [Cordyceps militaris]|uniref:Uncharacterized protein n=1 Tax=Cordyceps militaris TaxID=73501 RepID=A0A2H4SJ21_CORMI|nr:hypothetical protein A9K55_007787 [Cordyceps militaris]
MAVFFTYSHIKIHDQRRGRQSPNDSHRIIGLISLHFPAAQSFSSAAATQSVIRPRWREPKGVRRRAQPAHGDLASTTPSHLTGQGQGIKLAPL